MSMFGKALQARRKELGLTREQFSKLAEISQDYLTDIEIRHKTPSWKRLNRLIRVASCVGNEQALASRTTEGTPAWSEVNQAIALELILLALDIDPKQFNLLMRPSNLKPGSIFVAITGGAGMKTEYVQGSEPGSQCLCVTLEAGE